MILQFVRALEGNYVELKSNLYLLTQQTLTDGPEEKEACQSISPSNYPSTSATGPSIPAQTERRPVPLGTLSPEEGTLVEHREEHTDYLPHCPTTSLAF